MAKRIEWTEQRKARLRQLLVDEGLTYRQAARRMNLRYNQVKQAALTHRLGNHAPRYPWREWDRAEYDTVERLLEQGRTYAQIAQAMSLTLNQVKGAAQRLGLMDHERLGSHRREIPGALEIIRDCIEVERMTVPMIIKRLEAYGHIVSRQWVHNRISEQGYGLRKELLINAAARRARGRALQASRDRAAKRNQEAAA